MPIQDLPREIHSEILSYLEELTDQIAAAEAFPLWSSLLQTISLQATRYHSNEDWDVPYPLVHKFLVDICNQISCVVRNEVVECYRLRFLKQNWWENPNMQDTWDISNCPFFEEPLLLRDPRSSRSAGDGGQRTWKVEVQTRSPLNWSYPQSFECKEGDMTVRDYIEMGAAKNINVAGYLEAEGLSPAKTYLEIIVHQGSKFGDRFGSDPRSRNWQAQDPETILINNVAIVGRSTKLYLEWLEIDEYLQAACKPRAPVAMQP